VRTSKLSSFTRTSRRTTLKKWNKGSSKVKSPCSQRAPRVRRRRGRQLG
jgi:hypothetical protein